MKRLTLLTILLLALPTWGTKTSLTARVDTALVTKELDVTGKATIDTLEVQEDLDVSAADLAVVNITASGLIDVTNTTESTSTTTGSIQTDGGLGVAKDIYAGDDIFFTSGAVLNFSAGDVTVTHAANALTIAGGDVVTNTITGANAAGPAFIGDEAATATNPTLVPNKTEEDTGFGWAGADILTAVTGGTERMRIDASGDVGVGQTDPTIQTTGWASTSNLAVGTGAVAGVGGSLELRGNTTTADQTVGVIVFSNEEGSSTTWNNTDAINRAVITSTHVGTSGGDLHIWTKPDGAAIAERVEITDTGKIGIGKSPEAWNTLFDVLQIGGNGALISTATEAAGNNTIMSMNAYYDGAWKYIAADEASYSQQGNGAYLWSVAPAGSADGAISWVTALQTSGTTAGSIVLDMTTTGNRIDFDTDNDTSIRASADDIIMFETGGNDRLSIDANGTVTIQRDATTGVAHYGGNTSGLSMADDATTTLPSSAITMMHAYVNDGTYVGLGCTWMFTYTGTTALIYDGGDCAAADTDTKLCAYKSANSHTTTMKNRLGETATITFTRFSI